MRYFLVAFQPYTIPYHMVVLRGRNASTKAQVMVHLKHLDRKQLTGGGLRGRHAKDTGGVDSIVDF